MRSKIASVFFIVVLVGSFVVMGAEGALTGTVAATVTAQSVAVTVTDGAVAFGTIALSGSKTTCTLSDQQTVTNTGNVNTDFIIKGSDTTAWTLGVPAASNVFALSFKAVDSVCTAPTELTLIDQSLATGVAASGTTPLNLVLAMPTATSSYEQQSITVTVTASAS